MHKSSLNQACKSKNQFWWEKEVIKGEVTGPQGDYNFKITFNKSVTFPSENKSRRAKISLLQKG